MKEFKLGDKVRVLEMAIGGDVLVGTTDFITWVDSGGSVEVGNGVYNYFLGTNGGKLELVKPEEFKLGDEVRVLEMSKNGALKVGTVGNITDVLGCKVRVGAVGRNWFFGSLGGKLELVTHEPVIKVGDIVERRNGATYRGKLRNRVKSISTCGKYLQVDDGDGDGWAINQFKLAPCVYPNPPQMHQKEIIEWAKGAQIQYFSTPSEDWHYIDGTPKWYLKVRYRVKPDVPDVDPRLELLNEKLAELNKAVAYVKKEIEEL
jgi:hypothetical protein